VSDFDLFFQYSEPSDVQNYTFLSSFSTEDWKKFLAFTVTEIYRPNVEVVKLFDVDCSLYIILQGEFDVIIPANNSSEDIKITSLSAGEIFGELSFFDGKPRSASVVSTTDSEVLKVSQHHFQQFFCFEPFLAKTFLIDLGRILANRLRIMNQLVGKEELYV
jgi:CRP/FNR family transcriptional regulator, cyclic AMP receptor protein